MLLNFHLFKTEENCLALCFENDNSAIAHIRLRAHENAGTTVRHLKFKMKKLERIFQRYKYFAVL